MKIVISQAIPEDAIGIRKVQKETWLCTYPNEKLGITKADIEEKLDEMQEGGVERMVYYINHKDSKTYVAKDGDQIVAYVSAYRTESKNKLAALYVLSTYHGMGIGRSLMEKALNFLGDDKEIILEVFSYNTKAIEFYKKFGFEENGSTNTKYSNLSDGRKLPEIEMIRKSK